MLEPVINDLILEQSGIFIKLGRIVKGTVQRVTADNLGAHSIAGVVENSSVSNKCISQQKDQSSTLKKIEVESLL